VATTSQIVPTAPLHGLDLTSAAPRLPHREPALARKVPPNQLDSQGALATEPGAADIVARWRDTAAYPIPPLLDPKRTELAAERERLARQSVQIITELQQASARDGRRDRGFQRKTLYATTTGEFRVPANIPRQLLAGPFAAGAKYRAIVRFSNAASTLQPDTEKDQRAIGVRITDDQGRVQDLTFTSGAAGNHARDARQFNSSMIAALHMSRGGIVGRVRGLVGLLSREGRRETRRLAQAREAAVDAGVSLAAMPFYSRSPIELGSKLVHLALLPLEKTTRELVHEARGARDGLGRDLCARRNEGDVRFRLAAAEAPGLDDTSLSPAGPWITVGELNLPRQRTSEGEMLWAAARVHGELALHPFNLWEDGVLTPRGELNEILRNPVYRSSAQNSGRFDDPPKTPQYHV
jgi:hypothetical protein